MSYCTLVCLKPLSLFFSVYYFDFKVLNIFFQNSMIWWSKLFKIVKTNALSIMKGLRMFNKPKYRRFLLLSWYYNDIRFFQLIIYCGVFYTVRNMRKKNCFSSFLRESAFSFFFTNAFSTEPCSCRRYQIFLVFYFMTLTCSSVVW